MNDLDITTTIRRLARPHPSGGIVIERAAILAAGGDSPAIIDWIISHSGMPETPVARDRGLHGSHINGGDALASPKPTRFVLPAGTFN